MKQSLLKYVLFASLPVLSLVTVPLHASIVFSENFETATINLAVTQAGQFNTINGTNVDVLGGFGFGFLCVAPESGTCVDLGGSGGNDHGDLVTTITLDPGSYYLSFDLNGSQRGDTTSTTVSFGDYSQTFILAGDDITTGIIVNQLVNVTGGPTQLQFLDNGYAGTNGDDGALLDDVLVTTADVTNPDIPTALAPEPATWGMMATGLIGLAGAARRRFTA